MKAAMTERVPSREPADHSERVLPSQEIINGYIGFTKGCIGVILAGGIMVDIFNIEAAGNLIMPRGVSSRNQDSRSLKLLYRLINAMAIVWIVKI